MKNFLGIYLVVFMFSLQLFGEPFVELDPRLNTVFDPESAGLSLKPKLEKETGELASKDVAEEPKGVFYGMAECIFITLRDSEVVQGAYVNQIANQFNLRVAEHAFEPQGTITLGASRTDQYSRNGDFSRKWTLDGPTLNLTQQLLTGGSFNFVWSNGENWKDNTINGNNSKFSDAGTNLSLTFTQPLLKGAGLEIGTLPLQFARITYEGTLLSLKTTLMGTITQMIKLYRQYVLSLEGFKIQQATVKRQRDQAEWTRKKVKAGIEAPYSLIYNEANLTSNELTFEQQENATDQARIALLRFMNVNTSIPLIPDTNLDVKTLYIPTVEECLEIAFANDPAYLQELLNVRTAELNLMQAKNNLLWALNFQSSITASSGSGANSLQRANDSAWTLRNKQLSAGLNLTIPVNDISTDQVYLNARIGMRKARINLRDREETMKANFQDLVRNIKSQLRQVEIAKRATEWAKQQLNAASIRYRNGLTSAFEADTYENTLVSQEQLELQAKITLLNLLTDLDQALGTTLQTWQVDINPRAAESPRFRSKFYEQIASKVMKK